MTSWRAASHVHRKTGHLARLLQEAIAVAHLLFSLTHHPLRLKPQLNQPETGREPRFSWSIYVLADQSFLH